MQSDERLRRVEQATEVPLLILAFAMVPLLLGPVLFDLSDAVETSFLVADWFIWAAFATAFGLKLAVAPSRLRYVRANWLEVAMVALPLLRPIRLLRLLRFARLATAVGYNETLVRRIASEKGTQFTLVAVLTILATGAGMVLLAERDADGANIHTYGDALWWAATTMTTVGYGDLYPTTPAGRGIAVALMLFGIAALSVLTATIAAFLVRDREDVQMADVMRELERLRGIEARLDAVVEEMRSQRPPPGGGAAG
ncbi:MAG: two pore domain potassium channel family protein [Chloroflexi bacterium]|nr:two pore domain potassium channel family protein [Chloroflexota bacterium]